MLEIFNYITELDIERSEEEIEVLLVQKFGVAAVAEYYAIFALLPEPSNAR